MAKLKYTALALIGVFAVFNPVYAHTTHANHTAMAMMYLNASLPDLPSPDTADDIWNVMRQNFRMAEVNTRLVRSHENKLTGNPAYFDRIINRSKPYLYHITHEVKKRNMPAEIALLPFIESAFVTKATSPAGASGLWQFMPATGRRYGLERTALYDGRHDVYAATAAALDYLEYLYSTFGNWPLALAAYNWGEGNIIRAVSRARSQGLMPTYENLRMPKETRNYVPKLLAVRNIINNPQAFGINLIDIENKPYFHVIDIDKPIDTHIIKRFANISKDEFLALNPAFKAAVFVPKTNRKLLLPVHAAPTFTENYHNAKSQPLLSHSIYTAGGRTTLKRIAAESGISVAELKRLNNISDSALRTAAGQNHISYRVKSGDTLFEIARRYNLSVADLVAVNKLKSNNIRPGQILKIARPAAKQHTVENKTSYIVRKGDTLSSIAKRFKVNVADIRRLNRNTHIIIPGQRLKLRSS